MYQRHGSRVLKTKREKPPGHHLVTAFEAINDTLHEIYLGTTDRLLAALLREHAEALPARISHWKPQHRIRYRSIDYAILSKDADRLLITYAKSRREKGWKLFRQPKR